VPIDLHAGAWTLPAGHFWTKLTFLKQATNEEYVSVGGQGRPPDPTIVYTAGDRARYRFNGMYDSRALFFDLTYGVTDRLGFGIQLPFYQQQFSDDALLVGFGEPRKATGFGDIRGFLKFRIAERPLVATLKVGTKVPTGKFVNEDGIIPVGEGQWDYDFVLQLGRSFWPIRGYATADIGYRLRMKNADIDRDPGEEFFFLGEVGYSPLDRLLLSLKLDGIRSRPARILGITSNSTVRRVTYLSPTVGFGPVGKASIEAALRITLGGQNYPAGQMLVIGVSYSGDILNRR
jgi:hypothetical protein